MKDIPFVFTKYDWMAIDGKKVYWNYHHRVTIRLHEQTETFSCKLIGPECMSLRDLKIKLARKFSAAARAEARRKYVEQLDAEQRAQELIGAKPMPVDELVR